MTNNYRKKPVVIEARQVDLDSDDLMALEELAAWCGGTINYVDSAGTIYGIDIKTLEGTMLAGHGDWIIRGVQGEFYPCKPDIFAATYEEVE